MKYNIGDSFWIVPGYEGNELLIIKCNVIGTNKHGYLVDEVTIKGYVTESEAMSLDEARKVLHERYNEAYEAYKLHPTYVDVPPTRHASLDIYRDVTIKSIQNCWNNQDIKFETPNKTYGVDWFAMANTPIEVSA